MLLPKHIAIIMDGNGRWAKKRLLPRVAGHKAGVDAVRAIVKACAKRKIEILSLFAFSSENWQRPQAEVSELLDLFFTALAREVSKLHENQIRLKIIGDTSAFSEKLQIEINKAEKLTEHNSGLTLVIAANYGGRWDITQACKQIATDVATGKYKPEDINADTMSQYLSTAGLAEPDLFIRTSGEQRISNFLLWQLAYSELYFVDKFWPDFREADLDEALAVYAKRERRFGAICRVV